MQPGVGPVVLAEVVVRRVLAAEDGAGLGHDLLDEAVADPRAHRRAAVLADDLGHGLRADAVVEDRGAGLAWSRIAGGDDRRRRASPRRRSPCSSTRNTRSASPSKASPTSAPTSSTRALRSRWFSGWIGSAGWFGNVPSSSGTGARGRTGRPSNTAGHDEAAHAVGGVGDDLQRPQRRRRRRTSGRGRRSRRGGRCSTCAGPSTAGGGDARRGHRLDRRRGRCPRRRAWRRPGTA